MRKLGLALWVVTLSALLGGCPSKESAGVGAITVLGAGVINDPANKSLRFDLLKFGLERFCIEMRRRGTPLKLRDGEPNVGRFFAEQCQSQVLDEPGRQSVVVKFSGRGYGWTNVTGRLGFTSSGLVEYAPDFQLDGSRMYVYFRPRNIDATSFQVTLVESQLAQTGIAVAQVDPNQLGRNIVESQLRRGFTVIRHDEHGETEHGMGLIPKGQLPFKPFSIQHSEKMTLDNDQTEVQAGQQDYIGGFYVEEEEQALSLTLTVDGTDAVDVLLIPEHTGRQMLASYTTGPAGAALPAAPVFGGVLAAGTPLRQVVGVTPGTYFLLIDHTAQLGQAQPVAGGPAAKVDYLVQLGDRP